MKETTNMMYYVLDILFFTNVERPTERIKF